MRRAWIEISRCGDFGAASGVALHAEGVDRNSKISGSSTSTVVALHAEGVDRNDYRIVNEEV